jgi:hypothetical protein
LKLSRGNVLSFRLVMLERLDCLGGAFLSHD